MNEASAEVRWPQMSDVKHNHTRQLLDRSLSRVRPHHRVSSSSSSGTIIPAFNGERRNEL